MITQTLKNGLDYFNALQAAWILASRALFYSQQFNISFFIKTKAFFN